MYSNKKKKVYKNIIYWVRLKINNGDNKENIEHIRNKLKQQYCMVRT